MTRYRGSCHCGAVAFEVNCDIDHVVECNCSLCRRAGWQLIFVPEGQLTMLSGEDSLQDYQFGARRIHHTFCRQCGVRAIGRGSDGQGNDMYAINTRCLEGFDPSGVEVRHFDGASL